ncbi:methyltransferase-like protein 7A [Eurytemora carolleeae]|uniref:methyltransferase-like protein 7A n=1 Tax=Eurytemora carolleeae TaxID=1294199 RepID=UPI000C76AF49|nr:methyltransferase-like protein 7A [Eurytemora carolleeae]|eukprot:XP_023326272.1 methyltransferase-like protein 7A [Eurytemora affinis]
MMFKGTLLGLLLMGWTITAIFLLSFNLLLTLFGKRFFAAFLSQFVDTYNSVAEPFKTKLFKELNEIKTGDKIKILEIGGGSGANFKYFTSPSEVTIVEPNPNFVPYFEENRKKYKSLKINDMKQGYGEDLKAAGIEDESFDAVIMTLVLCSVQDQVKCIKEIQRVLKPGGKFFFMEHVLGNNGDNVRYIQEIVMQGGFWPCMFDGCCTNRDTFTTMEQTGGWSKLDQTKYELPASKTNKMFNLTRSVIHPHLMGVGTK